ncbi:MAG: O-antigen ligase family protein [Phycisphaerales bacterium]|nr:O-antigen ligase family protein [Phycisphaerales bacterium]
MALCLCAGVVWYGAVTVDTAAPAYILAGLLGLMWAGKLFFARAVSWKPSSLHWPVLGFAIYTVVRYFTSPLEYDSRMEMFQVVLLAFVYFACSFNFYRSRDRTILLVALLALGFAEAVYGFWQFGTKADEVLGLPRSLGYHGRASGTFFCPNHLAGFLEMVIGLAIGRTAIRRFSRSSVERSAMKKILVVYATLFLITALIMTFSRSSWIALGVALVTLFFWGDWDWRLVLPRMAVAVGALCVIALVAYNVKTVRRYIQVTVSGEQDTQRLKDPSLGGRTVMWGATAAMIKDHPVLGTGPGTWQWFHPKYRPPELQIHPEHAHNDILQLAADYGVIGFAIVAWAFVAFYRHASVLARKNVSSEQRSFAVGAALAVTAIVFHSWFDFNMHILANALVLVALMGFVVAMDDSDEKYVRKEMPRMARYVLGVAILLLIGAGAWFVRPAAMAMHYSTQADDLAAILEWDPALAKYEQAVKVDPKFPEPHTRKGEIYISKARFRLGEEKSAERKELAARAVAAFKRSLELNPQQAGVLLRMALAHEIAGEKAEALRCYDHAAALEPSSALVYEQMGLFLSRDGDEKRAIEAFEKSRQLKWGIVAELNIFELKAHR